MTGTAGSSSPRRACRWPMGMCRAPGIMPSATSKSSRTSRIRAVERRCSVSLMVISAMVVLLRSGVWLELVGVLLADGFAGLAPGGHAAAHRVGVVSLFGEQPGRGGGADAGGADGNHGAGFLEA